MATVYLHIGAPKTATSTLQRSLSENHKKLLNSGVLYPRELRHGDAHHLLVCDLVDKYQRNPMPDVWYGSRPRGQAWPALLAEMARPEHGIDKVILSTELFFGQSGKIGEPFSYLGYTFSGKSVSVRSNSIDKLKSSIAAIFTGYKHSKLKNVDFLLWRLNLRITGCVFEKTFKGLLDALDPILSVGGIIIRNF